MLPLQQGTTKEMEVNGDAGKFSEEKREAQQARAWSGASCPGVTGFSHSRGDYDHLVDSDP